MSEKSWATNKTYMHNLPSRRWCSTAVPICSSPGIFADDEVHGTMKALSTQKLTADVAKCLALTMMNRTQREEFDRELECNFAISLPGVARRVNVFQQQASVSMVIRTITSEIPNFEKLGLPAVLKEVITAKRGLVLVVGGTGSGKSTTMAAMIDHRNSERPGHIITVEDPVEYVHVSSSVWSPIGKWGSIPCPGTTPSKHPRARPRTSS